MIIPSINPVALFAMGLVGLALNASEKPSPPASTWPRPYSVERDATAGVLSLRTPYYCVEHNLRNGGVISRITLSHGKSGNLLAQPIETRVRDENGTVFSDIKDPTAKVTHDRTGVSEIVTVDCALLDAHGRAAGVRVKSTFEYRWGYVKVHKQFQLSTNRWPVREVCPMTTILAPNLCEYGYREGTGEEDGAPPFSFGSNRWGKLRAGQPSDPPVEVSFVPRSMIFVDPGVEGLEWFRGSNLAQWDLALSGRRGQGRCRLGLSTEPPGLALALSSFWSTNTVAALTNDCAFDYYLAVPLLEGHAQKPWIHTSFNRNRGNWVSTEEIKRWAEQGYQTVHCHNDGDYYDDGLFWRDGSYPPYPDMDRYDKVLQDCRRVGIRTATYFSNKELHPSTPEFQQHGRQWARMNRKGDLQHNYFRGQSEFGAQMCLRSGWLPFLKQSIDRVLKNHPLDGVYYDWNVALLCYNPLHQGKNSHTPAVGHWDMEELLDLMEWTRQRVGPTGLIIVHNTTTPMFALENFADHVVATEWGYQKWTDRAPDLQDLPLEWSLAGARSRGVISYGTIDSKAPRRLHRAFAIEALLAGVTPWPSSPETLELLPLFGPLGDLAAWRFADWRNSAVALSDRRCASAVYSRAGEAYLLIANLEPTAKETECALYPDKLPHPLASVRTAVKWTATDLAAQPRGERPGTDVDIKQLVGTGIKITIPGDEVILIRVR